MIFLDPRVGSKHLIPIFTAMDVLFDVTPLEYGDVAFFGNGPDDNPVRVGIEIKGGRAGSDFLQSMQSGRLVGHQVEGIAESYDRRYLIVEGLRANANGVLWMAPRRGNKMRPIFKSDVERYLTGIEESGIRLRRTADPMETAKVIVNELYAFWQKPYDEHTSIPANVLYQPPVFTVVREDETRARIRRVAVALKAGIGVTRSKAVADKFHSIADLAAADVSEWADVEGVGKTIAGVVVGAIRAKTTVQGASTGGVPEGGRPPSRSARHSAKRQNRQLDTGRAVERRAAKARTGHRVGVRRVPQ